MLGTPTPARGRYLYQRREGSTNQPVLYVRDGLEGTDRVAIDPNALSAEGTTALDWYHVSPDGRRLAYGLSADGSEQSVLQVLDLDTLAPLADRIPHTRSCDLAWLPDATGFYYTRYPAPGSVPPGEEQYHRAIWFHRLGDDPAADRLVFTPAEKEHWPGVALSDDGRWLVIGVARTFDETDLYLQDLAPGGQLVPVAIGQPATFDCQVAHGVMYIRTNLDAPTFRLYTVDPAAPARDWREIVPARPDAVLSSVGVTASHLVLDYLERATARVRLAALDGGNVREVALPTIGSLFGLAMEPDGTEVLFGFTSFTVPPSVYRLDLVTGTTALWRRVEADIDPERFSVSQVEYPSADGTRITMFLVHRRDVDPNGQPADVPHRVWRLQHLHDPGVLALDAAVARVGWRRGHPEPPRAAASTASRGTRTACWAGSRTPSTISSPRRSGSSRAGLDQCRTPRCAGRVERRPPHGCRPDPAARPVSGRRGSGSAARHAALSSIPDRAAVDTGVRLGR